MKGFLFNIPTKIIFGKGKIKALEKQIPAKANKILIVTDAAIYKKTDIIKKVKSLLKNYELIIFKEIYENPTINSIDIGGNVAKKNNIDLVIGVGGGSAMDAAKGIAIKATNPESIQKYISGTPLMYDPFPVICIPTTSGTGSEVTPFTVLTDLDNKNKIGYANDKIYPIVSIIDPELTYSMPKKVALNTGLDSFSHAVEAFLSTASNDLIEGLALQSIDLVINNLEKAIQKDPVGMENMSYSAMLSGIAISHASTILPHIMGYPLTVYYRIPHGRAGAILLPGFLDFLRRKSLVKNKIEVLDKKLGGGIGLEQFFQKLGVSTKLVDYGINKSDFKTFVQKTITKSDISITPGEITENVISELYNRSYS